MVIILMFGMVTPIAGAVDDTAKQITVKAESEDAITIEKQEEYDEEYDGDYNGLLILSAGEFNIDRDYSQSCVITVKNYTENVIEYYLTVNNPYEDLYMNFVRSGSVEIPLIIQSGETQQVQLDIFAQNAENTNYSIPVYAHVVNDGNDEITSKVTAKLICPEVVLDFKIDEKSNDEHSLAKTFNITNHGDALTDVSVSVEGDADNYVSFDPIINNYPMDKNESVTFKMRPDLTKMKNNDVTVVTGQLVISSGGKSVKQDIKFDTKGQEIVSITIGELAELQNGGQSSDILSTNAVQIGTFTIEDEHSQCTNAGKIKTDFYLDDIVVKNSMYSNAVDPTTVELYVTSRMSGGSYVNSKVTNYDYILNGKTVGRTTNGGLTEMSIAKLPTDNLKFGERNTLIRDYDTNPGSHFVTSDTQIIITVPASTVISYIGSPATLADVRSLPDFAIYSENIYPENDLVYTGETTNINLNVYNRGSQAGTFDISVSDGTDVIYTESDYVLDAFAGGTVSFEWTPVNETNSITVTLTNKSEDLEDRDATNNVATKKIVVVERTTPTISNVPNVSVEYGKQAIISVDVNDTYDVDNVEFYIDDVKVDAEVKGGLKGVSTRYYATVSGYEVGTHAIKAVVNYLGTDGVKEAVEGTGVLTILDKQWKVPYVYLYAPEFQTEGTSFTIEANVENAYDVQSVKIIVDGSKEYNATLNYNGDYSKYYYCTLSSLGIGVHTIKAVVTYATGFNGTTDIVESSEINVEIISAADATYTFEIDKTLADDLSTRVYIYDEWGDYSSYTVTPQFVQENSNGNNVYTIMLNGTMIKNKESSVLYVYSSNAVLFASLSNNGVVFDKASCSKLTFKGTNDFDMEEVYVRSVNDRYAYIYKYTSETEFYFTKGNYSLEIEYYMLRNYNYKTLDLDLTSEDKVVDFAENIRSFDFKFADISENAYNAYIYYKADGADYWNSVSATTDYNKRTGVYTAYVVNEYNVESIDNASEVYLVVMSDANAIYETSVKGSTDTKTLDRSKLYRVFVNTEDPKNISVGSISITKKNMWNYNINGNEVYLANGDYIIDASCNYSGGKTVNSKFDAKVENKNLVLTVKNEFGKINFKWSEAFNYLSETYIYGTLFNGSTYSNVENGGYMLAVKDTYEIETTLYRNDSRYRIYTKADNQKADATVEIGDTFTGKIVNEFDYTFSGNSTTYLMLEDLFDSFGNELNSFYSYNSEDALKGTVKFTNVNDANDVVEVDVVANQLDDYYYITLPNIDGEYMISLELKTDNINNESNLKVPEISVYYDEREVLYGCGDLPVLYVDGDVDGNIRWLSQGLVSGTNEYSWIFTPYDSDEYKTVTGTITITVGESHSWSEWISNNDSTFFKEGTKKHSCLYCGYEETVADEGSAGYHEYLYGGDHSWITVAIITAIASLVAFWTIHLIFWWIPGI